MSGLAELSQRHARLAEISGIMTAMKSLSLVEAHKLARFIGEQRAMRDNIEAAAADFFFFHPDSTGGSAGQRLVVVIGSERGFCGNFNERIIQSLADLVPAGTASSLVVVGHRLGLRLASHPCVRAQIDGPTVAEEVPAVLDSLLDALHDAMAAPPSGPLVLQCLAHDERGEPALATLLPLSRTGKAPACDPPQMLLAPAVFRADLVEQLLLAGLQGQLYASLSAESHQRLAHMERAIDRLEHTLSRLALKRNALRQERIVEEIEVMLSNRVAARTP